MQYKHTESRVKPAETEKITNRRYFIRRNITEESRTDENGAAFFMWVYDEAVASEAEYAAFLAIQGAELRREAEIVDEFTLQLINEGVL